MSLVDFIKTLGDEGVARVPVIRDDVALEQITDSLASQIAGDERTAVLEALSACDRLVRADWPLTPPDLHTDVALKAVVFLYQSARLVLSRQIPAVVAERLLTAHPVTESSASAHYSVDLFGRYLPDLMRLAGYPLSDDAVVLQLKKFGERWPLSSVGVKGLEIDSGRLDMLLGCEALRQGYVDRVLRLNDVGRLEDQRVAEAARTAIGPHADVVGGVVSASLWPAEETSDTVK